jgi:thiamine biosynthesis protein ThiS
MKEIITVVVNGLEEKIPVDSTLAYLIGYFNEADKDLIVELNGKFVHAEQYADTKVNNGDILEFINPHFGG